MPKYAYACTQCGHSFDIHQSFSDDALTVCPECEGRLRKVFGAVGVVFKGSGFYRTDSRSSSSIPASSDGSSSESAKTPDAGKKDSSASNGSSSGSSSDSSSAPAKSDSGTKAAAPAS